MPLSRAVSDNHVLTVVVMTTIITTDEGRRSVPGQTVAGPCGGGGVPGIAANDRYAVPRIGRGSQARGPFREPVQRAAHLARIARRAPLRRNRRSHDYP